MKGATTVDGTLNLTCTANADLYFRPAALAMAPGATLNVNSGHDSLEVGSSPMLAANNTINISAGAGLTIRGAVDPLSTVGVPARRVSVVNNGDLSILAATHAATVSGGGSIVVGDGISSALLSSGFIQAASLTIRSNASVILDPASLADVSDLSFLNFDGTSAAPQGQLDLGDATMIIRAGGTMETVLPALVSTVLSGRDGGSAPWIGQGITSHHAAADPLRGVAVLCNRGPTGQPFLTTLGGHGLDANCILLASVWNGDADLSGKVDADDYHLIDRGFLSGASGYLNGDFNFDGRVDVDDYYLLDSTILAFGGHPMAQAQVAVVPEPVKIGNLIWLLLLFWRANGKKTGC